jgi:hypothetical protein
VQRLRALAAELRIRGTFSSHQVLSAHKLADALFPRMVVRCRTPIPLITLMPKMRVDQREGRA